jgi:hypothetical protein
MEKGCQRCDSGRSIENENLVFILDEGDTRENIMTCLKPQAIRFIDI